MSKKKNREEFAQSLDRRLSGLQGDPWLAQRIIASEEGEEPMVKKTSATMIILVALIAVLSTSALAAALNAWGLIDFAGSHVGTFVPANYEDSITIENKVVETDSITCTFQESYYDGKILRLTVKIDPKKDVFLLTYDSAIDDPVSSLFPYLPDTKDNSAQAETIGEYTLRECEGHLLYVSLGINRDFLIGSCDSIMNDDGSVVCYMEYRFEDESDQMSTTVTIRCIPGTVTEGTLLSDEALFDFELEENAQIGMTFSRVGIKTLVCDTPMDFPEVGVRVIHVEMMVTPLEIRYNVDFEVTDLMAFNAQDDGLFFEFINPNSTEAESANQRLNGGLTGGGTVSRLDGRNEDAAKVGTVYRQADSLGLNELSEQYTIRAYNCWDKTRYESETFSVTRE